MTDKHLKESAISRNIINTAAKFMQQGAEPGNAILIAKLVRSNEELITKINVLKRIEILDKATKAYLYSIQLTDDALQVEPKINAIWTLVKTAGIVDDSTMENAADIPDSIDDEDNVQQIAINVIDKILST